MSKPVEVDVFFDFTCPYVHAAGRWVEQLESEIGDEVKFNWRFFPLEQVNSPNGPEWKLWETGKEHKSRTRESMRAAAAARRQGADKFRAFHQALLNLRHEQEQDHGKKSTILKAAKLAKLDIEQFETDLKDDSLLAEIGSDYEYARGKLGVFGTPTFVFPGGGSAYIKLLPPPPAEDAVQLWREFAESVNQRRYLREIKRPVPPE